MNPIPFRRIYLKEIELIKVVLENENFYYIHDQRRHLKIGERYNNQFFYKALIKYREYFSINGLIVLYFSKGCYNDYDYEEFVQFTNTLFLKQDLEKISMEDKRFFFQGSNEYLFEKTNEIKKSEIFYGNRIKIFSL